MSLQIGVMIATSLNCLTSPHLAGREGDTTCITKISLFFLMCRKFHKKSLTHVHVCKIVPSDFGGFMPSSSISIASREFRKHPIKPCTKVTQFSCTGISSASHTCTTNFLHGMLLFCNKKAKQCLLPQAVLLYCCPDYPNCPANLSSTGWATWAIWVGKKPYCLIET